MARQRYSYSGKSKLAEKNAWKIFGYSPFR
jgi:hypothetical protein